MLFFIMYCLPNPILSRKDFVLLSTPESDKGIFPQYFVKKYGYRQVFRSIFFEVKLAHKLNGVRKYNQ